MPHGFFKSNRSDASASSLNAATADRAFTLRHRWWWYLITGSSWLAMLAAPIAIGSWAVVNLLELPSLPQCWAPSWTADSSTSRLYCAKLLADKQTVKDLQQALQMISSISKDDPLWDARNRLNTRWSQQLLQLGEEQFQAGKYDEAMEIAQDLPDRQLADARLEQWQSIWEKAESLYDEAIQAIDRQRWADGLAAARGLLAIGNRYWATTQHQELMRQLQTAKEDQRQQRQQAKAKVQSHQPIEDLLTRFDREQQQTAQARLAEARRLAARGDLNGLKAAVDEASQLLYGDPYYDDAQQAIGSWQRQIELIEDQPLLNQAIQLARKGDESSLSAAVDQASQIDWGRALYSEAQTYIDQWRDQIYQLQVEARSAQLEDIDRRFAPIEEQRSTTRSVNLTTPTSPSSVSDPIDSFPTDSSTSTSPKTHFQ